MAHFDLKRRLRRPIPTSAFPLQLPYRCTLIARLTARRLRSWTIRTSRRCSTRANRKWAAVFRDGTGPWDEDHRGLRQGKSLHARAAQPASAGLPIHPACPSEGDHSPPIIESRTLRWANQNAAPVTPELRTNAASFLQNPKCGNLLSSTGGSECQIG
jgi:hypothetical protein